MNEICKIKDKIAQKKLVIGTGVSMTEISITEILGDIGFDFVWVDQEHTPLDKGDIQSHIVAARGAGVGVFVRIPWNDPVLVKPILEMAPAGIIFPFIKTAEEAKKAVKACLYPPEGIRGFGPRRAIKYGLISLQEYLENYKKSVWRILQIEHVEAVNNLEEIMAIDGVDSIVVGPNDLSGSIGLIGQTKHKEVKVLMDRIAEVALKSGKPFGVSMGYDVEAINEWLERGVAWIEVEGDTSFFLRAAKETYQNTKGLISNFYGNKT